MYNSSMRFWILMALVIFLLSGCCGQPSKTSTSIEVTLQEYRFLPAQWRIPAGQEITLTLKNEGRQEHDWVLLRYPPTEPFDGDDEKQVLFRVIVGPGESKTVQFRAPAAAGEYSVASSLPGELEEGMTARVLVVQPGY
jgi:uncharacterized cupredoxin-like copper-binding protein